MAGKFWMILGHDRLHCLICVAELQFKFISTKAVAQARQPGHKTRQSFVWLTPGQTFV